MNWKPWVAGVAALAVGCAPMQTERRVERGPLLRTYSKESVLGQRQVAATVEARWPKVTLRLVSSDVCRNEQHEEYVENVIIERYEPSAAPAISGGTANAAIGAGLLLARPLFSNEPDRDSIDREGRYGASSRKIATGWGVALVALGVPALVTGLIQSLRAGEETQTRKADTVVSLREESCHPQPATGTLEFAGGQGAPPEPRTLTDGTLELTAEEVRGMSFAGVLVDGEPAAISEEDQELLATFRLCGRVLAEPLDPTALAKEDVGHLQVLRRRLAECKAIPGAPVDEPLKLLDAALAAHGNRAQPLEDKPSVNSFEEAVAAYKPSLNITANSEDLEKLRRPEALRGQAVLLRGVLERREEQNIALVQVGDIQVLVFLEPDRLWAADFPKGSRVELVGVVMGQQQLGDVEAPLVRGIWMRTAL
ncbi:hypothetical protein [Hyalangium rubrum]|uniref:Lipoprotein n=1 Tax=Hyalangium rubrum TaxID=3103134 RepID=A0ABU5H083_9BACT|nr:hypothetical protein [Hyalangium sp. s54d21]MDY7226815.1 hypothetical protein [Hyalangium sp. s54d21]